MPQTNTSLERYMGMKIVVLKQTSSLREASLAMAENNIGCVLVANSGGELVGILTDRDLALTVSVVFEGVESEIAHSMSEEIAVAPPEATVEDVIGIMANKGVRRVPIVTQTHRSAGKCIGIVTLDDLIATRAISVADAARIIEGQIQRPPRRPQKGQIHHRKFSEPTGPGAKPT